MEGRRKLLEVFKQHYYLDLKHPPCAEYFVGTVDGELVLPCCRLSQFSNQRLQSDLIGCDAGMAGAGVGTAFKSDHAVSFRR